MFALQTLMLIIKTTKLRWLFDTSWDSVKSLHDWRVCSMSTSTKKVDLVVGEAFCYFSLSIFMKFVAKTCLCLVWRWFSNALDVLLPKVKSAFIVTWIIIVFTVGKMTRLLYTCRFTRLDIPRLLGYSDIKATHVILLSSYDMHLMVFLPWTIVVWPF